MQGHDGAQGLGVRARAGTNLLHLFLNFLRETMSAENRQLGTDDLVGFEK